MNKDVFNSFMKNIDWEKMDSRLMLRQDPVTRAARKRLFLEIDGSKGGALDVKELKLGVEQLLTDVDGSSLLPMGDELLPAVRCAFNASKNIERSTKKKKVKAGKKAKVGVKEFHAFLIAFKYYLQLIELFEFLDGQADDNQLLSLRECRRGLFLLNGWGITETELEEKFKGVDTWVSHMPFEKFAKWCIEESGALEKLELDDSDNEEVHRAGAVHGLQKEHGIEHRSCGLGVEVRQSDENVEQVMQLFHTWDSDGSGAISEEELGKILKSLDPQMTPERVSKLFAAADHNKDGSLCYNEFLAWILK